MKSNYFIPLQSQEFAKKVFQIIKSGEPGTILFPPNSGKSNRLINAFIENNRTRFLNFEVLKFDFTHYEYEGETDLIDELEQQINAVKKKKVVFFISNVQNPIMDKNYFLVNSMIDLQEENPRVQFIFILNIDITNPAIVKNLRTSLFSYIYFYPLYNKTDSIGFVNHLLNKWEVSIPESQKEELIDNCGGYFWLLKQALICLKDNPKMNMKDIVQYDGVKIALEHLYGDLLDSEREVIKNIIFGHKVEGHSQKHSLNYLEKTGVINNGKITIPFLVSYIKDHLPKMMAEVKDNHIHINSVNVDNQFSKNEKRLFRILIEKKNFTVSRDDLASAIWPNSPEESYSDWAVDRLVARLRVKIKNLGMSEDLIKTVRNQGYIFSG